MKRAFGKKPKGPWECSQTPDEIMIRLCAGIVLLPRAIGLALDRWPSNHFFVPHAGLRGDTFVAFDEPSASMARA